MVEQPNSPSIGLDEEQWSGLDAVIRRYEASWSVTVPADMAEYLPRAGDPWRRRTLIELIKVDQELCWQAGQGRRLEQYVEQWPELVSDTDGMLELLCAECLTRAVMDAPPRPEEIAARFPQLAARIDLTRIAERAQCESVVQSSTTNPAAAEKETSDTTTQRTVTPHHALPQLTVGGMIGRYEIRALLGWGGMGAVYRAYDTELNREVALKTPRFDPFTEPVIIERFLREARAAAAVRHPNICPIYDVGESDGKHYITMALVNGQSLKDLLATNLRFKAPTAVPADGTFNEECLPPRESVKIIRKLATALAKLHTLGILHRDINVTNVMIDESGEPMLLDFGLAREVGVEKKHLTSAGSFLGTPAYMSPEQLRDAAEVDERSDIYSLGVVMYQLITGQLPFTGSLSRVMTDVETADPPRLRGLRPEVDEHLEGICLKALKKSPAHRFQTAAEFAAALEQYERLADVTHVDRPQRDQAKPQSCLPRRKLLIGAAFLAACFAAILIFLNTGEGQLELTVNEPDISVRIDGQQRKVEISSPRDRITVTIPAGKHVLEVTKDGFTTYTDSFMIRRGGKVELSARLQPVVPTKTAMPAEAARPAQAADPDRRAAEWVLSVGGTVRVVVDGTPREVVSLREIPDAPFYLDQITLIPVPDTGRRHEKPDTRIHGKDFATLAGLTRLTDLDVAYVTHFDDVGLSHVAGLTSLTQLSIAATTITDAGLEKVSRLANLRTVYLNSTAITDDGLASLASLANLRDLSLTYTKVTGPGLVHLATLPKLEFLEVSGVDLTDAALVHLKGVRHLKELRIHDNPIAGAGLVHLDAMKELRTLWLSGTHLTDEGLANLPPLENLKTLSLYYTRVSGPGLQHLSRFPSLMHLALHNTDVGDGGLKHVEGCISLTSLSLGGTKVTDAGLQHLVWLPKLTTLNLSELPITDEGLVQLTDCKSLMELSLHGTLIGDSGIERLGALPQLRNVYLERTGVTQAGLFRLKTALPTCEVKSWSYVDPNRRAAEWVLRQEGRFVVTVDGKPLPLNELPAGPIKLREVYLPGPELTDHDLVYLTSLPELETLDLRKHAELSSITGDGLSYLRASKNLTTLNLSMTQATDALGNQLLAFPKLKRLTLVQTKVTDQITEALAGLPDLTHLNIRGTQFTDTGVANLVALAAQLESLDVSATKVTDAALPHLAKLGKLKSLHLGNTEVTDAGLEALAALPNLTELSVPGTKVTGSTLGELRSLEQLIMYNSAVTDETIKPLAKLTNLKELSLDGTRITGATLGELKSLEVLRLCNTSADDQGLKSVATLKKLNDLKLIGAKNVSDAAIVHIGNLAALGSLELGDTQITDASLPIVRRLRSLTRLGLGNTRITDAGARNLRGLTQLFWLDLSGTQISDIGLLYCHSLSHLGEINLERTAVTPAGIARFRAALPNCVIKWSPASASTTDADPNRRAAEWVLSIGGTVRIDGAERDLTSAAEMPREKFSVVEVVLAKEHGTARLNETIADNDLTRLKGLTNLKLLRLDNCSAVTDAGLAHIADLTSLTFLSLAYTNITDDGLIHLSKLTNLKTLNLGNTPIEGRGLEHVTAMPGIEILGLSATNTKDDALVHLKGARSLKQLLLEGTHITGTGFMHLRELPSLTDLYIGNEPLTDGGMKELANLKQLRELTLNGSVVADGALRHIARLTNLRGLSLPNSSVSDESLKHVSALLELGFLSIGGTKVTDAGLKQLAGLKNLSRLDLEHLPITDDGLTHLKNLPKLGHLSLVNTRVSGTGLTALRELRHLHWVGLHGAPVTPEGLAQAKAALPHCRIDTDPLLLLWKPTPDESAFFETLPQLSVELQVKAVTQSLKEQNAGFDGKFEQRIENGHIVHVTLTGAEVKRIWPVLGLQYLTSLNLSNSGVDDIGPLSLATNLRSLNLTGTKISKEAIEELQKALPGCKIHYDARSR